MPPRTTKTAKHKAAKPAGKVTKPAARRAKKRAPARKPKAGKPAAKRPARSKAKPAKRPAPPKAEESQEQTEPLLLEPIPDDAVVKYVLLLLGLDGLVQLMASSKTICERLGAVGTPAGKAARKVVDEAYGVAMPADADVLDCSKRLHRWTRHQQVSHKLDVDIAKAFACGTVLQGCEDELFFGPRPGMHSIASGLAKSASWLVCEKKFGPRYFDDEEEDIVTRYLQVGEAVDLSAFDSDEVEQGVHSRVRLNKRVAVDFEVSYNFNHDDGGATFYWDLRVEIQEEGGPSQPAEGLAHSSGDESEATFGEPLWCGCAGYGEGRDDRPHGREIHGGCAARLIAALGMTPQAADGSVKHLMGVLLYILAAPFLWELGTDAVGPALESTDEVNTMLEVIRHQVLLACEWEEEDEGEWDADDERYSSFGKPPRPLRCYRLPAEGHRTGLWWLGKDPPSDDDFEPPRHSGRYSGNGSSDDDDEGDSDSD
jgi:hypothetical protein